MYGEILILPKTDYWFPWPAYEHKLNNKPFQIPLKSPLDNNNNNNKNNINDNNNNNKLEEEE
jgi:hypothetical protein